MGEMQGILMGDVMMPSERENCGADKQGKMGGKIAEIEFLKLEIMLEMDISRQTK